MTLAQRLVRYAPTVAKIRRSLRDGTYRKTLRDGAVFYVPIGLAWLAVNGADVGVEYGLSPADAAKAAGWATGALTLWRIIRPSKV